MENTKQFKFSMFAKPIELSEDELVLYSSYLGMDKIVKIQKANKGKVEEWINSKVVKYEDDIVLNELISLGYFVDVSTNEKLLRQNLINTILYDNNLHLVIHTTEDCNFRCNYCALDFEKRALDEQVADSIIQFIRKNISKYSSVTISWFGGEPMLNIGVIERISNEVIKICKCAKKPFNASITTNGYLLTKKNMELLYNCNVRNYTVTIDGNRHTHDKQRHLTNGGPTFDKIIDNLLAIRDNKNLHVNVTIRTNVTAEILEDLEDYYKFLDEKFGGDNRFDFFIRLAGDWGGERVKEMKKSLLSD